MQLIGVHLKEGTHKIELRYTTPGVQTELPSASCASVIPV